MLSDLDCDVDQLLSGDDGKEQAPAESHVHAPAPVLPQKRTRRRSQAGLPASNTKDMPKSVGTLSERRNANLRVDTSRAPFESSRRRLRVDLTATSPRDSLSPEPLRFKQRDRFAFEDAIPEHQPPLHSPSVYRGNVSSLVDVPWPEDSRILAPWLQRELSSSAPPEQTDSPEYSPVSFPRRASRFSKEERGAFLRAARDSQSSATTTPTYGLFEGNTTSSTVEAPYHPVLSPYAQHSTPVLPMRPKMPARSLLDSDRSLGSFFQHEYAAEHAHDHHWKQSHESEALSSWKPRGDSPTISSPVRCVSTNPYDQVSGQYSESEATERGSGGREPYEMEQYNRARAEALNHLEGDVAYSYASSEQTRGPFIITAASRPNTPTPSELEAAQAEAEPLSQERAVAEFVLAQAFGKMDTDREKEIERRLKKGPQKPKGFFGIKASNQRQVNFELAWDRLGGSVPDEGYGAESSGATTPKAGRSSKLSRLLSVRKKLFRGR